MRVLVISDTHKYLDKAMHVIETEGPFDRIFHLGDMARDARDLEAIYQIPVHSVLGNCDYYEPDGFVDLSLELEGKKILLCHGHTHHVKMGMATLKHLLKKEGYDYIFYGHTHVAKQVNLQEKMIINPGSISEPRDGNGPGYGILTFNKDGNVVYEQKNL